MPLAPLKTRPAPKPRETTDEKYERSLDEAHDLGAEIWGKGTAVSVDPASPGFTCRVWNPKGGLALIGPEKCATKVAAVKGLVKKLEAEQKERSA